MQNTFFKNNLTRTALFIVTLLTLTACDNATPISQKDTAQQNANSRTTSASVATVASSTPNASTITESPAVQKINVNSDGKIQLDWAKIDSGTTPVDKEKFAYKFALDSKPVQNYANYYHVDAKTARYNLTIGMAANEPLSKVLDQIGTGYVSHELTAGKGSKLVIHTTPKVLPSEHDYVIEDPFGKGLILPIQIMPDGKKSANGSNPHEGQ